MCESTGCHFDYVRTVFLTFCQSLPIWFVNQKNNNVLSQHKIKDCYSLFFMLKPEKQEITTNLKGETHDHQKGCKFYSVLLITERFVAFLHCYRHTFSSFRKISLEIFQGC